MDMVRKLSCVTLKNSLLTLWVLGEWCFITFPRMFFKYMTNCLSFSNQFQNLIKPECLPNCFIASLIQWKIFQPIQFWSLLSLDVTTTFVIFYRFSTYWDFVGNLDQIPFKPTFWRWWKQKKIIIEKTDSFIFIYLSFERYVWHFNCLKVLIFLGVHGTL